MIVPTVCFVLQFTQRDWKVDWLWLSNDVFGFTRSVNKVTRLSAYRTIWQHCGLALHMKVR